MNEASRPSLLEFPCDFPIKIVGHSAELFELSVLDIIRRHVPDMRENAITSRASSGGRYTSLTITIRATSQEQLDAIYMELSASSHVLMAL
jgi:putative lipoic acid-binding regulatory protein